MPRASTAAKITTVAMCFIVASYPLEEIIPRACSPSTGTGGNGRQKRPRFAIFFLVHVDNRWSMGGCSAEVTGLLKAWSSGDEAALERLAERVYPELRLMARRYLKNERHANTLQTTAL